MTLDECIKFLQEAKEHGIDGKTKVLLSNRHGTDSQEIFNIAYDNKNCYIIYE